VYKTWSKSNTFSNKYGKSYYDQFLSFMTSDSCTKSILLAYERAKRRKVQECKGIFKHEPTSMEYEGMEQDEADAIKMAVLHGSYVPDDTWSLPRGFDYDSQGGHPP
jgi:hypothetical protein